MRVNSRAFGLRTRCLSHPQTLVQVNQSPRSAVRLLSAPQRSILTQGSAGQTATTIESEALGEKETAPSPGPSDQGCSPWRGVSLVYPTTTLITKRGAPWFASQPTSTASTCTSG